jgi:hypothetical protein
VNYHLRIQQSEEFKMVYYVSTLTVPESPGGENLNKMVDWAKRLTKRMQSKWPEWDAELLTNFTGPTNEIHWISKYESPDAREALLQEYHQDEDIKAPYEELYKMQMEAGGNLVLCEP